jgi:hypothetical protein
MNTHIPLFTISVTALYVFRDYLPITLLTRTVHANASHTTDGKFQCEPTFNAQSVVLELIIGYRTSGFRGFSGIRVIISLDEQRHFIRYFGRYHSFALLPVCANELIEGEDYVSVLVSSELGEAHQNEIRTTSSTSGGHGVAYRYTNAELHDATRFVYAETSIGMHTDPIAVAWWFREQLPRLLVMRTVQANVARTKDDEVFVVPRFSEGYWVRELLNGYERSSFDTWFRARLLITLEERNHFEALLGRCHERFIHPVSVTDLPLEDYVTIPSVTEDKGDDSLETHTLFSTVTDNGLRQRNFIAASASTGTHTSL